jgi:hypothetical protein
VDRSEEADVLVGLWVQILASQSRIEEINDMI